MREIIRSSDNKTVKEIRKLRQRKNRDKFGKCVIESRKLLMEALESNVQIEIFLLREDVNITEDEFSGTKVRFVDYGIFNEISTLESPDGYMAIINIDSKFSDLSDKVLILDKIQDPGNLGTMIRSAEAFGFNTVCAIDSVDPYNEKSIRASMGSIFRIGFSRISYEDLEEIKKSHKIFCADMSGKSFKEVNFSDKIALVIGNEANGISNEMKFYMDDTIKIDMLGKIESLNAAISASILMNYIINL
ncbi:MAG: RNA methyltransferase [Tissierellia bacterium]|nr:RNA methyltransferase [Tissierellia bacterium]